LTVLKMTTETFIKYEKNYLPGYTGHVPNKNYIYGCTAGDINNLITNDGLKTKNKPATHNIDVYVSKPMYDKNDYHVNPPAKDEYND